MPEFVTRARFQQTEFVVMHGHSCLSGLVTGRGRGGGHKVEGGGGCRWLEVVLLAGHL